jgi:hypothetical protein
MNKSPKVTASYAITSLVMAYVFDFYKNSYLESLNELIYKNNKLNNENYLYFYYKNKQYLLANTHLFQEANSSVLLHPTLHEEMDQLLKENKHCEEWDKPLVRSLITDCLSQDFNIEKSINYLPSFLQQAVHDHDMYKHWVNEEAEIDLNKKTQIHAIHGEAISIAKTYLTYKLLL